MKKSMQDNPELIKKAIFLQHDIIDLIAENPDLFEAVINGAIAGLRRYEIERIRNKHEKN